MIGVALVLRSLRNRSPLQRLWAGAAAGVALFGFGLSWAGRFTLSGYIALVVVEAAFLAAAALATPPGPARSFAFPGVLVLVELARWRWPLGGLPLASPVHGQVDGPLLPVASIGGAMLVLALTGFIGAAVERWLADGAWLAPSLFLMPVALAVVAAALWTDPSPLGTLRVAAVQGGGPRGIAAVVSDEEEVFIRHLRASAWIDEPVDLVVWPEDVVDLDEPLGGSEAAVELALLAGRLQAHVVAGVVEAAGTRSFRNAAVAWSPTGRILDRYEKVHRVPFGEYVPARNLVSRVADLSLVPRDALPGSGPGLLQTPAGGLGVVISYEVFFPERARAAIRAGGKVLLVPTNAASYTGPGVPAEELAAARLRAVETTRAVVQSAPTGYTAFISSEGRVKAVSQLEEATVLQQPVATYRHLTPYTLFGDLPALVTALLLVIAGLSGGPDFSRNLEPVAVVSARRTRKQRARKLLTKSGVFS